MSGIHDDGCRKRSAAELVDLTSDVIAPAPKRLNLGGPVDLISGSTAPITTPLPLIDEKLKLFSPDEIHSLFRDAAARMPAVADFLNAAYKNKMERQLLSDVLTFDDEVMEAAVRINAIPWTAEGPDPNPNQTAYETIHAVIDEVVDKATARDTTNLSTLRYALDALRRIGMMIVRVEEDEDVCDLEKNWPLREELQRLFREEKDRDRSSKLEDAMLSITAKMSEAELDSTYYDWENEAGYNFGEKMRHFEQSAKRVGLFPYLDNVMAALDGREEEEEEEEVSDGDTAQDDDNEDEDEEKDEDEDEHMN